MAVTEAQALAVVSVETMRAELRIPPTETSQDALLIAQIVNAVNYVMQSTGRAVTDLDGLQAAAISLARELYDGRRELPRRAAVDAWLDPFRSYKAE